VYDDDRFIVCDTHIRVYISERKTHVYHGQWIDIAKPADGSYGVYHALLAGKRGLVMGVANNRSIAWGIAKAAHDHGAELAFTYQGEALGKRVKPLANSLHSEIVLPCDVEDIASVDAVFEELRQRWGKLDFVVHAIGFSDKNELKGRYIEQTTRENFSRTMVISCFSFTEIAQRAAPMMNEGGSLLTLTYGGATRVMPNYNVMGLAKAALESSVRYLASDLGPQGIRVNAISAGPIRTLAGAGIGEHHAGRKAQAQRDLIHRHDAHGPALLFGEEAWARFAGMVTQPSIGAQQRQEQGAIAPVR
jgi:enoyl-[acyl-carrier protein] reductase I